MCGILIYPKKNDINKDFAANLLKHRGPDAFGIEETKDVIFCHTLLQIRGELKDSIQPKYSRSKRYLVLFNGQIYNTRYLNNLVKVENNDLDTNYILELIEKYGIDGINYIDGMFALVVYDFKLNNLFFTRDPSGQKNLYYNFNSKNELTISSEINPILKILNNEVRLCKQGVSEFFMIGFNSNKNTIYDKIFKLLPGEIIQYSYESKKVISKSLLNQKFENSKLDIKKIISENIIDHLISKKKISLNLSGGIDSNLILSEILRSNINLDIFSTFCDTKQKDFNEDFYLAKNVAKKNNLNFFETIIDKKQYLENIQKVNELIEEPSRNPSNTIYYLNFKNISSHQNRSVLSGAGGDEVFIGYPIFFLNSKYQIILDKLNSVLNTEYISKFLTKSIINFDGKYSLPKEFISNEIINSKKNIKSDFLDNFINFKKNFYPEKKYNSFNFLKLFCLQYSWLSNESFVSFDKMSMSQSIEVRAPFASQNFRKNFLLFTNNGHFKSKFNKPLIRTNYYNELDESIINNYKKTGWSTPKDWILSDEYKDILLDLLPSNNDLINWSMLKERIIKNPDYMNKKFINSIVSFLFIKKNTNLNF